MMDHLCDECKDHFDTLKMMLDAAGLPYAVDTKLVRGLDYYTKTVFEIIAQTENGPLTLLGGGRYDGLVEEIGGPSIPGVGFGMGMERVLMHYDSLQDDQKKLKVADSNPDIYIAPLDRSLAPLAFKLLEQFRGLGLKADMNHTTRGLRAQFKFADKLGASYVAILGEDEAQKGVVKLRDMKSGDEWEVSLADAPQSMKQRLGNQSEEACSL